jgi:hypothetical protein
LANEELSQSMDDLRNNFSTLLSNDTFLDNTFHQNSLIIDIKTTLNEKSEALSMQIIN